MMLRLSRDAEWIEGFFGWYDKCVTVEGVVRSERITVCFICGMDADHILNLWPDLGEIT